MKSSIAGGMILSAALLALVLPQSAASLGAYAQTPSGSALTVEALDTATYQPVETQAFGDSTGDGAADASAIVLESITGTSDGVFTVLAVYVNVGGTPKPAVTVG